MRSRSATSGERRRSRSAAVNVGDARADLAGRRLGARGGDDDGFLDRRDVQHEIARRGRQHGTVAGSNPVSDASTRQFGGAAQRRSARRRRRTCSTVSAPMRSSDADVGARQRAAGLIDDDAGDRVRGVGERRNRRRDERGQNMTRTAGQRQPPEAETCASVSPSGVSRAEERTPPDGPGFLTRGSTRRVGLPSRRSVRSTAGDGDPVTSVRRVATRLQWRDRVGIRTHFAWPPGRASDCAACAAIAAGPRGASIAGCLDARFFVT